MVQPHSIGEMIKLLPQPTGRQLTDFDVSPLPRMMPLKPGKRAENDLQRLSQVMSRHCKQDFIELARARQVLLTSRCRLALCEVNHDISPTVADHFGDPIRVVTVQLGGSLAGKLSFRLSSIFSSDNAVLWLADPEDGSSRVRSSLARPRADRRDMIRPCITSRAAALHLMEEPCFSIGV
jgi:hypothetical protein